MNKKLMRVEFHTPVFACGINAGNILKAAEHSSRYTDLALRADDIGVYVRFKPEGKPTIGLEEFIPWSNVKSVTLAPEDRPSGGAARVRAA